VHGPRLPQRRLFRAGQTYSSQHNVGHSAQALLPRCTPAVPASETDSQPPSSACIRDRLLPAAPVGVPSFASGLTAVPSWCYAPIFNRTDVSSYIPGVRQMATPERLPTAWGVLMPLHIRGIVLQYRWTPRLLNAHRSSLC